MFFRCRVVLGVGDRCCSIYSYISYIPHFFSCLFASERSKFQEVVVTSGKEAHAEFNCTPLGQGRVIDHHISSLHPPFSRGTGMKSTGAIDAQQQQQYDNTALHENLRKGVLVFIYTRYIIPGIDIYNIYILYIPLQYECGPWISTQSGMAQLANNLSTYGMQYVRRSHAGWWPLCTWYYFFFLVKFPIIDGRKPQLTGSFALSPQYHYIYYDCCCCCFSPRVHGTVRGLIKRHSVGVCKNRLGAVLVPVKKVDMNVGTPTRQVG